MAKTSPKHYAQPLGGAVVAPAHLSLAGALERRGRLEDAIALYEAALRSDPGDAPTLRALAGALLTAGRPAEAFGRADAALALDFADAPAWALVGRALDALGEPRLAAQVFERALSLEPSASNHVRLAQNCEALDRPQEAAAQHLRALALKPGPDEALAAHVGLSGLYGRARQYALARAHADAALALAPEHQGAHQNLAAVCDEQGFFAEAEAHRERAYRAAPFVCSRAAQPRRRVLTLASAARGNTPDARLIPADRYDRTLWFLAYGGEPRERYDVVFNAVGDADDATLARVAEFVARSGVAPLNPPDRIARTARDKTAELFGGVSGLCVPPTRRVVSAADLDGLDPNSLHLLRPVGSHGGERALRLPAREVGARLDGAAHYLAPWIDTRSTDGLFRKYRVVFVGRQPYPYHLAASADWLVHYQTSLMPGRPDLLAEERRFLADPEAALGSRAWAAVAEIGARLDLDFAGVDFAVLPDGRVALFEANATMLVHPVAADGPLAFKAPCVEAIWEAFWERLEAA